MTIRTSDISDKDYAYVFSILTHNEYNVECSMNLICDSLIYPKGIFHTNSGISMMTVWISKLHNTPIARDILKASLLAKILEMKSFFNNLKRGRADTNSITLYILLYESFDKIDSLWQQSVFDSLNLVT